RRLHVLGVRGEKLFRTAADRLCSGEKGLILGRGIRARDLARGGSGAPADFEHVGLDVQRSVHEEILPPGEGRCRPKVIFVLLWHFQASSSNYLFNAKSRRATALMCNRQGRMSSRIGFRTGAPISIAASG